jgi:F0F1-type ATP synthase membrane subunit b/b'
MTLRCIWQAINTNIERGFGHTGCLQAELERILEENNKQLEQAKRRAAEGPADADAAAANKLQSLAAAPAQAPAGHLGDDVYVLGSKL